MWPWRRRVEVVLTSSAGDSTTAALTMILRYHRRSVTLDEVRQAIHGDRTGAANANQVVAAAEHFRLHVRGLGIDHPTLLTQIPTPNIAHMMMDPGPFPRRLDQGLEGTFVVVVSISPRRIRWIDPDMGQRDREHAVFLEYASGVFLVFDDAHTLPRARLRSVASDR
jgi:ABC-type bacteriocin/lantibiotic exporter with double-glycine peptidase domain